MVGKIVPAGKFEFENYIKYYVTCLTKALELSIGKNKIYFTICKNLHKKELFRKKEIASLFSSKYPINPRFVLQDLASSGVFIKGETIGFLEKFNLAYEVPTIRGRVVRPTEAGKVVGKVLSITGEDLYQAQQLMLRSIRHSEDLLNDICFQGQLLYLKSNSIIQNLPRNYIERELLKLFIPIYEYNNNMPIKKLPPLILCRGIEVDEGPIDGDGDWKIEIYFEASPNSEFTIELNELGRALGWYFSQIIPFMQSIYIEFIRNKKDVDINILDNLKNVFEDELYFDSRLEVLNSGIITAYCSISIPSIRRCVKWLGL